MHANLARGRALVGNKDFEALGNLVMTLERIAAMELRQTANQPTMLNLESFLEELRIVIAPRLREEEIHATWNIPETVPPIWADRQSLMQVFLNLVRNSEQAMENSVSRQLTFTVGTVDNRVSVQITDSGCGIDDPESLFRPFQHRARFTGLGLYVSRAIMRSFRGDLHFVPSTRGATFLLEFAIPPDSIPETYGTQATVTTGR